MARHLSALTVSALVMTFLLSAAAVVAQTTKNLRLSCGTKNACFPYEVSPRCSRGNRMNLRFMLDLAPENYKLPQTSATYAFCPIVDELQAFNLSGGLALAATKTGLIPDPNGGTSNISGPVFSKGVGVQKVSVWGMGDMSSYYIPNSTTSYGSVGVVFNNSDQCNQGELGVVNFLVLNVTLNNGQFQYYNSLPMPVGGGFAPTCDSTSLCKLDMSMKCFGEEGKKNCGTCVASGVDLSKMSLQIWTSYYGTDVYGKKLTSGSSNPLNFREFAGQGLYSSMKTSYGNAQQGNSIQQSDVTPTAGT